MSPAPTVSPARRALSGKVSIAGVYEHPTRWAPDKTEFQIMAESAKGAAKAQAKEKVAEVKDRATTDTGKPRPELAIAVLAVAAVVGLAIWRRSHR